MSENTVNNRMCFKFIEFIQLFDEFKKTREQDQIEEWCLLNFKISEKYERSQEVFTDDTREGADAADSRLAANKLCK